jgi:hypothetical protein
MVPNQHNGRSAIYKPIETAYLYAISSDNGWGQFSKRSHVFKREGLGTARTVSDTSLGRSYEPYATQSSIF